MLAELQRSKSQLKLADVQAPYYIDYRLNGCRSVRRPRRRLARCGLRCERASACCASWCGWATTNRTVTTVTGEGVVDVGPLDDDEAGLRHQLWLGTDRAYKAASEAFTAKQAELKKYSVDQQVDDFAHASPVQLVTPLASLDFSPRTLADNAGRSFRAVQERSAGAVAECFAAFHGHQPVFRKFGRDGGAQRRQLLPGVCRRLYAGSRRHAA